MAASGRGKSDSLTSWCFSSKLKPIFTQIQRRTQSTWACISARLWEVFNQSIKECQRASWPHLPAFPVLHDHSRHFVDAPGSVVFIVRLLHHFLQVLHVCPHQHVPQQQEVRVSRVLHWQMQQQQQQQRVTGSTGFYLLLKRTTAVNKIHIKSRSSKQ